MPNSSFAHSLRESWILSQTRLDCPRCWLTYPAIDEADIAPSVVARGVRAAPPFARSAAMRVLCTPLIRDRYVIHGARRWTAEKVDRRTAFLSSVGAPSCRLPSTGRIAGSPIVCVLCLPSHRISLVSRELSLSSLFMTGLCVQSPLCQLCRLVNVVKYGQCCY